MPTEQEGLTPTWTKYICTIGPASSNPEVLEGLVKAGANIIRNNFAHAQYDEYRQRKALLDSLNEKHGTKVEMQADLQGPNIRVGSDIPEEGMDILPGVPYTFYTAACTDPQEGEIFINDETLHLDVKAGEPITFMDGALEGQINEVNGSRIVATMINGGKLKPRKSVNVPDTDLSSPAITEKDRRDLEFLMEAGVDWIALSFIGSRKEVDEIREIIGDRPIKIMTKIERRIAIKNIAEIIDASDAVMIARGDLGIEMPMEELPILQRMITNLCKESGTPVVTATQMLMSMTNALRPTRAEVSDVANAVFAGSDAIMLSEETAAGIDPVNALKTMVKIARRVEDYKFNQPNLFNLPLKKDR
ncbi:MAG: pyruvate kinase, pyruvate kinase [Patescibacteria group bacterium]|jgi:pyruvate kinase|nr:pyruvate kinase, pyruvate kinase [Patescibacteria group bacterium]